MRWTSREEKGMIKEWAEAEKTAERMGQYLPQPDAGTESYWERHDETGAIMEYSFESISDLKEILEKELPEEFYKELLLPLAVATFKGEPSGHMTVTDKGETDSKQGDGFEIPEFVYVF